MYPCEVLGSHSGAAEVLVLLGCWSVSLGECFATFLRNIEKFKLGYNVMKGTEYFVSLQTGVVITKDYIVVVNSQG